MKQQSSESVDPQNKDNDKKSSDVGMNKQNSSNEDDNDQHNGKMNQDSMNDVMK